MFPRVLLVVGILNRELLWRLLLPFVAMALPLYLAAIYFARDKVAASVKSLTLRNPLELGQALKFAVLLAAILLASKALQKLWGPSGLYVAAVTAGLADVDAITISIARMTDTELPLYAASTAGLLAAMTNTLTKGVLAASIGGKNIGTRILIPVALALAFGAVAFWTQN
jgi:uncharacterized membrane protein (DUF4010 family)